MQGDIQTQVTTIKDSSAAIDTAVAALENDLNSQAPSTGDQVLTAVVPVLQQVGLVTVFGTEALSVALTAEGYTVAPPAAPTQIPVQDGTDTPTSEEVDPSKPEDS